MKKAELAATVVAALITAPAASAATAAQTPTSSLDGRTVLPHRIRWVAHPGVPSKRVAKVEFLTDGTLRWVEHKTPYVYGDDSDWLVTSWLAPGPHRFTVRVVTTDGHSASRTTTARTVAPPAPPADLANTAWKHVLVNQGELGAPAGVWALRVRPDGWEFDSPAAPEHHIPKNESLLDVAYLAPGLVELRGGIWTRPRSIHEGNGWCEDSNQAVRYRYTVVGDQLTLELAGPKRCGDQATVLAGAGVPRSSGGGWTAG
jgi:hypothetical protein